MFSTMKFETVEEDLEMLSEYFYPHSESGEMRKVRLTNMMIYFRNSQKDYHISLVACSRYDYNEEGDFLISSKKSFKNKLNFLYKLLLKNKEV